MQACRHRTTGHGRTAKPHHIVTTRLPPSSRLGRLERQAEAVHEPARGAQLLREGELSRGALPEVGVLRLRQLGALGEHVGDSGAHVTHALAQRVQRLRIGDHRVGGSAPCARRRGGWPLEQPGGVMSNVSDSK